MNYENYETRVIRPIEVDSQLESSLQHIQLHIGNHHCGIGEKIDCASSDFEDNSPEIEWASDIETLENFITSIQNGAAKTGLDTSHLSLVVIGKVSYLKTSLLLLSVPASELSSLMLKTQLTDPLLVFSSKGENKIVVSIVLNNDITSSRPLIPTAKATWLARAEFKIDLDSDKRIFKPRPLTDEVRDELRLVKGTVLYLELKGEVTDQITEGNLPILWIDEETYEKLDQYGNTKTAELIQAEIFLFVLREIISSYSRKGADDSLEYSDIEGSPIGKVIELISERNAKPQTLNDSLAMAHNDPQRLFGRFEEKIELKKIIANSIEQA